MKRLLAVTLLAGCANGPIEGIPCTDYNDLECPTGYWCQSDLLVNTRWVCVEEESNPRPQLEVVGVYREFGSIDLDELSDDEFSDVVVTDRNYVSLVVRLRNQAGVPARVGFQPPVESNCCLSGPSYLGTPAVAGIAAGEKLDLSFDVRRISTACEDSVPFTIRFTESEEGKPIDYTFDLVLEPYVDEGTCDGCDYVSSNNCDVDDGI